MAMIYCPVSLLSMHIETVYLCALIGTLCENSETGVNNHKIPDSCTSNKFAFLERNCNWYMANVV